MLALSLRPVSRAYYGAVVLAGALIMAASALQLVRGPLNWGFYVLAALTIISASARLTIPSIRGATASTSISDTFIITAALVFGPSAGTAVAVLDAGVMSYTLSRSPSGWSPRRMLFNVTALAIAIWVPANVFRLLAGVPAGAGSLVIALFAFASLYFVLNTGLVAVAVGLERGVSPVAFWREHFIGLWLTYFGGTSVGGALAFVWRSQSVELSTLAVLVPLPLVLYFMFKNALGRTEDQITHLAEVNRLYLATIEALAHAIDAKDQVTHGHIRRVQREAVRLAEHLGIRDEREIKAIEAAALLHDMGKLAVPEHILNKPGRLSPAEFEIMKTHAPIGAEILSGIDFPYPVVPIVRHHHENWDGTGYPDGIRGDEIPIGARILSVVDCFDALTSDRPYRPRMTTEEAMQILDQRRGSMYDPQIVDAFRRIHEHVETEEQQGTTRPLPAIVGEPVAERAPVVDEGELETRRITAAFEIGRALANPLAASSLAAFLQEHLAPAVPVTEMSIYLYDHASDSLVLFEDTSGDDRMIAGDVRVRLGEGVSGWVAANRRAMVNADPRLELQERASRRSPALRSCAGVPCTRDKDALAGVIVVFSTSADAFTDSHRRLLEAVAARVAPLLPVAASLVPSHGVPARDTAAQSRTT